MPLAYSSKTDLCTPGKQRSNEIVSKGHSVYSHTGAKPFLGMMRQNNKLNDLEENTVISEPWFSLKMRV